MTRMLRYGAVLVVALAWTACDDGGGADPVNDVLDVIQTDNALPDPGQTDEGQPDPGTTDEGQTDNGTTDEGQTDEGQTDEGQTDEGQTDNGTPVDEFATLIAWLEGDGGNYINSTAAPKVIAAADVMAEGLENWIVVDVRTQDKYGADENGFWKMAPNGKPDYEDGHIPGAILVPLKDLLTWAAQNVEEGDKILVVCHTGQNAGFGVLALNLMGFDAWSLKWGMASWHKNFDEWSAATSSTYAAQYVKDADPGKNAAGDYPTLATGETEAGAILEARLAEVLNAPAFVTIADLMAAPDDFYIVNYWPEAEYLDPGHVPGAHQYTPKTSMLTTADLATLPTDMPIAVYCYSGQHSAQVVAFLRVLGYDAYSLKFGTNGMIYDLMTKQTWPGPETGPANYTVEPAFPTADEFAALVAWLEGDGGNYINGTAAPKVIAAADVVAEGLENYVVLDLRTQDKYGPDGDGVWHLDVGNGVTDYHDGHIIGSTMVALVDLIAYVKANLTKDDKILVVCYTGQNAGIATAALNLMGYDAWSLKWGMSAWNDEFDNWTLNTSSTYWGQFVTDADTGRNDPGDYPVLATGKTDVQSILEDRLVAVLGGTPKYVKPVNLFAALDDYYIVNYWPEAEYLDPGHIPGAHQYTPKTSLLTTSLLATLPTDKAIAVYCYSGQHSAQVVTYLNALGYDAWSVLYGTNGMMYDNMPKQKWPGPVDGPGDYPWEPSVL